MGKELNSWTNPKIKTILTIPIDGRFNLTNKDWWLHQQNWRYQALENTDGHSYGGKPYLLGVSLFLLFFSSCLLGQYPLPPMHLKTWLLLKLDTFQQFPTIWDWDTNCKTDVWTHSGLWMNLCCALNWYPETPSLTAILSCSLMAKYRLCWLNWIESPFWNGYFLIQSIFVTTLL